MKELFASSTAGITGLLFFFFLFVGILIWLYRPGAREEFQEHGNIPLKDERDE